MVLTRHKPRKHNLMEKCEKNRRKKMINLCAEVYHNRVELAFGAEHTSSLI